MISMFIKIFRAYTLIIMNTPCAPKTALFHQGMDFTTLLKVAVVQQILYVLYVR